MNVTKLEQCTQSGGTTDDQPLHWSLVGNHHPLHHGLTFICTLLGWGKEEGISALHILVGAAYVNQCCGVTAGRQRGHG
jgi:hypothetical protein